MAFFSKVFLLLPSAARQNNRGSRFVPGGNGMCSKWCLRDAVFELVAHEESESWTSLPHSFTKEGLLQLPG